MRALVFGLGSIGRRHTRVLAGLLGPDQVFAIPARTRTAIHDDLGDAQVLPDRADVAKIAPDICVIATETGRHVEDARWAIEIGAHVLIEKPLSHSLAGVDALRQLAAARGRRAAVACNFRFHPALLRFKDALPQIGAAHTADVVCQSYLPDWRPGTDYRACYSARAEEGGVMRDLVHEIDYCLWLWGRPRDVDAKIFNLGRLGIESEEMASLRWTSAGCPDVRVHLDYLTRPTRRHAHVAGEFGSASVDLVESVVRIERAGADTETLRVPFERDAMMAEQARAMIDLANGGRGGNLATLEDGAEALRVIEAAQRSQRARQTADLEASCAPSQ